MHQHHISRLASVLTQLPISQATLPNDDKTFKLKLKMVSNRAKQPSHDTHSH